jgi:2-oxoglutarate dehydrogenase E2 component (dihydrolipoamide succinyltransferase)
MSQIVVPQLGESVVEARVARWLKNVGDAVTQGEPLVELETDKIDLEVGADQAGVLARIDRQAGEDVKVGEVLAVVEPGTGASATGAAASEPPARPASSPSPAAAGQPASPPPISASPNVREQQPAAATGSAAEIKATATARRMAEDHAVNLSQVPGSGDGGRVTKDDVQKYLAGAGAGQTPAERAPGSGLQAAPGGAQPPATPGAQPAARAPSPAEVRTPAPASQPAAGSPRARKPGERSEERVRMSKRRATIAKRLVEAQHTAAMLTTFNEVDMSAVMALRARRKEAFQKRHGVNLGLSSFFVKASLGALRAFPRLNAEVQGDEMVLKHYYDVGIAVGASGGLVVPVLRDVDTMSFAEIEFGVRDFAKRAEDGTLTLEDLTGGTFTITNGGVFGSLLSTPILNPPQVGILGLHKIEERPVAVSGQVVVKPMMYVALSYDHRIVDGLEAVQFLVKVKELIEDPGQMLIEL